MRINICAHRVARERGTSVVDVVVVVVVASVEVVVVGSAVVGVGAD